MPEPAAFPGRQPTAPPVPQQPVCHFDGWSLDPDGLVDQSLPIGSAATGPDLSGRPLEYARYLIYGFDVARRQVWAEVDCYMVPSAGGIDGYVATAPEPRRHGAIPHRFYVPLVELRSATVHHRTGVYPSSLHTDMCDHPLVENGRVLADHARHRECFELYVCQHRASDLRRSAREHGEDCSSWAVSIDYCDGARQLATETARTFEHAYLKRVSDQKVVLRHRTEAR